MQKKELWSTDMFFQKESLLYLTTELPYGGGQKINLHRRELVLQSTEKTKGLLTDITLQENV